MFRLTTYLLTLFPKKKLYKLSHSFFKHLYLKDKSWKSNLQLLFGVAIHYFFYGFW